MNNSHTVDAAGSADPIDTVAVLGAGSIGLSWAIVFASAGLRVRLYETNADTRDSALAVTAEKLTEMSAAGLVDEPIAAVMDRITVQHSLEEALAGAGFVQEAVVEDVDVKIALF